MQINITISAHSAGPYLVYSIKTEVQNITCRILSDFLRHFHSFLKENLV